MPTYFARPETAYPTQPRGKTQRPVPTNGRSVNPEVALVLPGGTSCSMSKPEHGNRCLKLKCDKQVCHQLVHALFKMFIHHT